MIGPSLLPADKFLSSNIDIIQHGGICVRNNWISPELVQELRDDIKQLRPQFQRSGLSNQVPGDSNEFTSEDRLTYTLTTTATAVNNRVRQRIEDKLDRELRPELATGLRRNLLPLTEHYYSISPTHSSLPYHMDERHELTKGTSECAENSRRSISWLLYLTPDIPCGGELRAYCRYAPHGGCGAAGDGHLQVGWLPIGDDFEAVFLDGWVQGSDDPWDVQSVLYRVDQQGRRQDLSDPIGPQSPSWPRREIVEPDQFAAALAAQLKSHIQQQTFVGVHSRRDNGCTIVEIAPTAGTLVLFDSVTVPHEVGKVKYPTRERLAMAGWFHEQVPDGPDWYGA